mmetsp:Transcript_38648/g.100382  ORF Transcript_38648/g.100382 Transcript_38648/m.100382 type:complete len:164 (+) Transcript_38648:215-706(+)
MATEGAPHAARVVDGGDGGSRWIVAARDLRVGEVVAAEGGRTQGEVGRYTIQVATDRHLRVEGPIMYTNHSCAPNCRLEMALEGEAQAEVSLVTLADVPAGETVTFDYNTTEWDMAEPFACRCGEPGCVGEVQGFKHLAPEKQQELMTSQTVLPSVLEALARA